jgi:signal transduction histidine kinase
VPLSSNHPPSPGAQAAHRARRVALAALYWGPILFLGATAALVVSLWRGENLSGLYYAIVVVLASLGAASGWILQRRLAEISQALERAQRASTVGLLTAGFAHEMKNALTVVLGFAELGRTAAERASPPDPKVTLHLKELENETRRTVSQLQSFLSYAAGERAPRIPRDVNDLLRDALQLIKPMARMKELQIEERLGQPPKVQCDPFAVRQLLLNLLLNALDFARTRIIVTTSADVDNRAQLSIIDDGPGVPEKDRARIFQRFVTTRPGGNGLGLSTSREIAEAHGGTLELSETPGGGATFTARFPGAATDSARSA